MNIEEYIAEVIKGLKQAFDLKESAEEVDKKFYAFDPMVYGDWGLTIGGYGSDYIRLCGCPVEFVVIGEPQTPFQLQVSVFGGATAEVDKAMKLIEQIENIIKEDIFLGEPCDGHDLYIAFDYTVNKPEEVSASIVKAVRTLTRPEVEPLMEELLRLCDK